MKNQNRIVRVRNEKVHTMLNYVATLTGTTYQHAFEIFLDYVSAGYVIGEYTEMKLIELVLLDNSDE